MANVKAGNIKKGMYLNHLNQPHYVVKTQFVSPGKGSAFTRTKLRNVKTGSIIEYTFKSHDKVEELEVESMEMQYLYRDGVDLVFMNPITYEQKSVPVALFDGKEKMLTADVKVYVSFLAGEPIGVSLPPKVKLKVEQAKHAVAGDRQNAGKKPVVTETGLEVQAPLFIEKGDVLIIDTESGEYVSRDN